MDRFLIETSHREQDCVNLVQFLHAQGYLRHFDWGCPSGVHTGWAILEADNEAEALVVVPPLVRGQARVVKLSELKPESPARAHKHSLAPEGPDVLSMHAAFPCWW
jgi:hypothetical protein